MTDSARRPGPAGRRSDETWLTEVTREAAAEAGGAPVELLGDHLRLLTDAAVTGRRPRRGELDAVEVLGRRASLSRDGDRRDRLMDEDVSGGAAAAGR